MRKIKKRFVGICAIGVSLLATSVVLADSSAVSTVPFYERLASDLANGKTLVTTVYVALCDNDSQGIVPVRNRSICDGDDPKNNMYWRGQGIKGYLNKHGWKKVKNTKDDAGIILIETVWKKRLYAGKALRKMGVPKTFTAYIVAKAYRGRNIHNAMKDYLKATNHDETQEIQLKNTSIHAGGNSHLVGFIGHDYFMDAFKGTTEYFDLQKTFENPTAKLAKGVFALACVSNEYVRPAVAIPSNYIMAMNNYLTFPSAWTVGGIIKRIARGGDGFQIYKSAAIEFQKSRKCGMRWAKKAFSYGP